MNLRTVLVFTITGAAVLGVAPGSSLAAPSVEDRLNALQQQMEALRDENRALKEKVNRLEQENTAGKALGLREVAPAPAAAGMSDAEFKARVKSVIKEEKPAPFVIPAGKETVLKLGGYIWGQAEFGDVDAWNGRMPSMGST